MGRDRCGLEEDKPGWGETDVGGKKTNQGGERRMQVSIATRLVQS